MDRALADPQFGAAVDGSAQAAKGSISYFRGSFFVFVPIGTPSDLMAASVYVDGRTGQVSEYREAPSGSA